MSGSVTFSWDWLVLIPLIVVVLLLVAAVVLRDLLSRIIVAVLALVIGAIFTWLEGAALWGTLVAWLFSNLLWTALAVAIAIAVGLVMEKRSR